MPMSLQEAGHTTGLSRTAILKAIKRGALSGSKDHEGWHVDGAELARVFQTNTQPNVHNKLAAERLKLAEERITDLKQRLDEMRQELIHARDEADDWKQQSKSRNAPSRNPHAPKRKPSLLVAVAAHHWITNPSQRTSRAYWKACARA
jgi:hypothetical protein